MTPPHARRRQSITSTLASALLLAALAGCAISPLTPAAPAEATQPPAPVRDALAAPPSPPAPAPGAAPEVAPTTEAAAPTTSPPAPRQRIEDGDDAERGDLWQRVRDGVALPDLDSDLVRRWEQYYSQRPDYVQRMAERGGRYLFHIIEEIERRGLPLDLALLPFIESAFDPQAKSRVAASGMWQFMPATGRDFELHQNLFRDDRRSVLASTRAALDYLTRLHQRFGDWHLALAAYNWGQGNVQRALDRNRRAGLAQGYEALRMPDETRNYVPKLQAVKNIVLDPARYGLALPTLENHPYFVTVAIERDIDVALVQQLAGMTAEQFHQLNPQIDKPVILAAGTPELALPYDHANRFIQGLASHSGPLASWTAWVAPRTLKPEEAARLTGMPEQRLRDINRIPPRMQLKAGSTLLVPRAVHMLADVSEHIADTAAIILAPEGRPLRRVVFRAGPRGDTVLAVAGRYRVGSGQVARWNGVARSARFAPGQRVVVMVAQPPAKAATSSRAAATSKRGAAPAKKRPQAAPAKKKPQRPPR